MLAEVLLVLGGHPSAFFVPEPPSPARPTTLTTSPHLAEYLHPGELSSLDTLAQLAFRYRKVRDWAVSTQQRGRDALLAEMVAERGGGRSKGKEKVHQGGKGEIMGVESGPGVYLSTLASSLLDVLREYDLAIVSVEAKILSLDPELVQDAKGYVPLSSVVATFDPWQAPLAALERMVDTLSSDSSLIDSTWSPGKVIELLHQSTQTGNPRLKFIFAALLSSIETLWLTHLSAFLLFGDAPSSSSRSNPAIALDVGADPLSPQHRVYKLDEDMFPTSVAAATRESILYVGRVASTLRRESRTLPAELVESLRDEVMRAGLGDGLEIAIRTARAEVGEWLWRHILTGPQVVEALEAFGDYFLTRNGDFALSVIREIHRLRLSKLVTANPHSSSSVIREQDLNTALLRASVGTSAESDPSLERLSWKMSGGPLRPLMPSLSSSTSKPKRDRETSAFSGETTIQDLFGSSLLGTHLALGMTVGWPLDLFLTPSTLSAYSDVHAYLTALRDTHLRVLDCWSALSASQRQRRKWTGTTEGGTPLEARARRDLARAAWGTVRAMLFFLDALQSHFMTDIIDVQHRRLLEELDGVGHTSHAAGSLAGSLRSSYRGSFRAGLSTAASRRDGLASPAPESHAEIDTQSIRSRTVAPTRKVQTSFLDFLTLRQMHTRHLSFLKEGLLISDVPTASLIRDVLDVCKRFTALVDRWGGDVLPELLVEGAAGEEVGELVAERAKVVNEITETLHELLSEFFRALLDSQNPVSSNTTDGSTSAAGASFSKTTRALQLSRAMSRQVSFSAAGKKLGGTGGARTKAEMEREERGLEAESLMGRHVEQLLLRLDFNRVLTDWIAKEEQGAAGKDIL